MVVSTSLIDKIYGVVSDGGIQFAIPVSSLRTSEVDLVRGVLRMLQGFSSSLFHWDNIEQRFCAKRGIYVSHLSPTSLHVLLNQFIYAATCMQLVEVAVKKVETRRRSPPPTLRAFASLVFEWLGRLRDTALKEEMKIRDLSITMTPTLLGLVNSLSSLCSGAEFLLNIVCGALPDRYFEDNSTITAAEIAVHVLDHLYKKLDEVCLVQGGEEEAYQILLYILVGSLLPYIQGLDSWLFEGTLDDPFEEMFFFANKKMSTDDADFWEKGFQLRLVQHEELDTETQRKGRNHQDLRACPVFIKPMAKSIISAGKSLQLIQHAPLTSSAVSGKSSYYHIDQLGSSRSVNNLRNIHDGQSTAGLTLSGVFCVSLAGLIGHGDRISEYLSQHNLCDLNIQDVENNNTDASSSLLKGSEKIWNKFMADTSLQKGLTSVKSTQTDEDAFLNSKREYGHALYQKSFSPENPAITVCQMLLKRNMDSWRTLNLSRSFNLPSLNDEALFSAIFGSDKRPTFDIKGTDYALGFQFGEGEYLRSQGDAKLMEVLFPFPTILPSLQDSDRVSDHLPFQNNSTLGSRVLSWTRNAEPSITLLPVVIVQECLTVYIKNQIDCVGRLILSKLMNEWKLMEELAVLRAIYLLGSGDMLQHFLADIFNKLDKGETWDDEFELNTVLQESIRNSADEMLLSSPDSLVAFIARNTLFDGDEQPTTRTLSSPRKIRIQSFGIDGLDSLKFSYKVSWPLELIAGTEAITKYNKVMGFLLRVKRAKFVLDKARMWMWKGRSTASSGRKRHWLLEQKLLHFVDAFHQYVMDRVYHSAWHELCDGMATAKSLDEVIEVHEAYLLLIQRQCFVVPDKLWALIASRINSILGYALDFYSIQQTLSSGGTVSAIKARCEIEVDRIEKQFDDCIAFLLRVLSFKINVGQFPHLADLVTRINYNNFYMSESGNLMTNPGSDEALISSRRRRAFPAKQQTD